MNAPTPSSTLADADGWWIEATCACGRSVAIPCRLVAREQPPGTTVGAFAARLRCQGCRARPDRLHLVDDPQLGASGRPDGARQRSIIL
jgi:hypothetical protein